MNSYEEWLNAQRSEKGRRVYAVNFDLWIQYCKIHNLPFDTDLQLEDHKQKRKSDDNQIKFFWDDHVTKFYKWLQTEYKGNKDKPRTEDSARTVCVAVRSFFKYHRYPLDIKGISGKHNPTYTDHAFDIYQLRAMYSQGDLKERTILALGKDIWCRVEDFAQIKRSFIATLIKREEEKATNEGRETNTIEFDFMTEKETVPCSCHISRETIGFLKEYLKTSEPTETLFNLDSEALNDTLKRLADKAKITLTGRVRWHCLRKFGVTLLQGKTNDNTINYMTGKTIEASVKTYIQSNQESWKAFKKIEGLMTLTNGNGNGNNVSKLREVINSLEKENAIQKQRIDLIQQSMIEQQKRIDELDQILLTTEQKTMKAVAELLAEKGISGTLETYDNEKVESTEHFEPKKEARKESQK